MTPVKHQVTAEMLQALKDKLGPQVEQQLVQGGEEGLTSRTLRRWLVARKFHLDKAAKDLEDHGAWRAKHTPDGPVRDDEVMGELEQNKAFLAGVDKAGHPTMVARVRAHKIAKDSKDFYRFMIWILDTAELCGRVEERKSGREWDGKVVGILDLSNITLSNCDTVGLMTIFDLLQNHYVERLHKMYLYCAPLIFSGVWAVVGPFVDPVTRAKVQFVTAKDAAEIFSRDYEDGVLPAEVGGTGPDRPAREGRQQLLDAWQELSKLPAPLPASSVAAGGDAGKAKDEDVEVVEEEEDSEWAVEAGRSREKAEERARREAEEAAKRAEAEALGSAKATLVAA